MVDLADRTSIENAVYWYSTFSQLHSRHICIWLCVHISLTSDLTGEIVASRKHSDKSASLPVTIYARKVYENLGDKGGIDLTGISWSRELRDTPFFYNPHKWLAGPEANEIRADEIETRPFQWIIEQLSGHPNVVCGSNLFNPRTIALPQHPFTTLLEIYTGLPPGSVGAFKFRLGPRTPKIQGRDGRGM